MRFFYDFLDYFKIDDLNDKVSMIVVFGVGLILTGKIKILNLSDELVELKSGKDKFFIEGENLHFKSISKGEIILSGKIKTIKTGEI